MKLGISTYAFRWELEEMPAEVETFRYFIEKTKKLGGEVFQICDQDQIESFSEAELKEVAEAAQEHGIELELGTQGIHQERIEKYAKMARTLHAKTLRTMVHRQAKNSNNPSIDEAKEWLKRLLPVLEENDVKIALETYEPIQTDDLVEIVKDVNSPYVGICLDPGNSISELEFPGQVIDKAVPFVTNVHLKDFVFTRKDKSIGFDLIGSPVGEGQLDVPYLLKKLNEAGKNPNAIVELWLPYQGTKEETVKVQDQWIEDSLSNVQKLQEKTTVN